MPYTEELVERPSLPAAQGKIVNPDGTPTKEMSDYMRRLDAFLQRAKAALDELEPP